MLYKQNQFAWLEWSASNVDRAKFAIEFEEFSIV